MQIQMKMTLSRSIELLIQLYVAFKLYSISIGNGVCLLRLSEDCYVAEGNHLFLAYCKRICCLLGLERLCKSIIYIQNSLAFNLYITFFLIY